MALQIRRGLESGRTTITPAAGEPLWSTDSKLLYIGDGVTPGGVLTSGGGLNPAGAGIPGPTGPTGPSGPSGAGVDIVVTMPATMDQVLLTSFSVTEYRSAKFIIQVSEDVNFQVSEMMLLSDKNTNLYLNVYSTLVTAAELLTIDFELLSDNIVKVYGTPIDANAKTVRILTTLIPV